MFTVELKTWPNTDLNVNLYIQQNHPFGRLFENKKIETALWACPKIAAPSMKKEKQREQLPVLFHVATWVVRKTSNYQNEITTEYNAESKKAQAKFKLSWKNHQGSSPVETKQRRKGGK